MDLKSLLSSSKNSQVYYWSLVLEKNLVQAGVWSIVDGKAEMLSTGPATPWQDDNSLIEAVDTALSAAIQSLPQEEEEPAKTVFGVPNFWVEKGEIKKEYLEKIRKVCSELALEPSGFVVIPEAIAHLIKSDEGTPLSGILLGISEEELEISVFRLGNLEGTATVARSVSAADDVVEGLTRFASQEPFPSRLILYDGKGGELEDIRQALLTAEWDKNEKVKFLHTPKIEIVDSDKKVAATALAGASEISDVTAIEVPQDNPTAEPELVGENVENVQSPDQPVNPEDLGFVMGEDISQTTPDVSAPAAVLPPSPPESNFSQEQQIKKGITLPTINVGSFAQKIKNSIHLGQIPKFGSKKGLITAGIIAFVLLIGGFSYLWFVPKANITIFVSPKKLEQSFSMTVESGKTGVNFAENIIPGTILKTQVNGDKTVSTTGTKTVGEKAKGSVKIQNGTGSIINLAAGTTLFSSGNLKFTTLTTASVSAAISPSLPGEGSVEVVAFDIGAEYNLVKDEIFKVGNYPKSEVDAVSTVAFSGGTSRQISAVSAEDQKNLEKNLTEELSIKAGDELLGKINEDSLLIKESLVATASARSFSKKIGDEADKLSLDLNLNTEALSVVKKDLFDLIKNILKSEIPGGYALRDDQIKPSFELTETKGTKTTFEVVVSVNLLPEVDVDKIRANVKGKTFPAATNYFNSISSFGGAEIRVRNGLLGIDLIPWVKKNIEIELAPQK
jgi:hypothetical protein